MEIKKSPKADLEGKKMTFILIGYVIILSALFVGFEWSEKDIKIDLSGVTQEVVVEEELVAITHRETTPPPPPPPAAPVIEEINIVENNKVIADVTIQSTEDDQNKKQEIVFRPAVVEEEDPTETQIFSVVEEMPQFPGGDMELMKYLSKNIKYPVIAQENGIQGRVICTFTVNKDGKIVDIEVVRGVDPSLDKEAMRVIGTMPPWKPGKQLGKAVRVKYTLPVSFRLQ